MYRFHLPDMSCGGCAKSVAKAVQRVDASARVDADLPTREVTIDSNAEESALFAALAQAGFPAERRN